MENEWSKLNDLKVGLDMASLALRPNIINMAAIYFNNGYYVVNFILLLLGFFSGFSLYILSESAAQLERYNYASLVGTAFSYKFILFCICVLKITRIIFTSNNLLAILSNYGLNKIVNDKISFLVMVFICYLLFSYYRKYYKYLALISGCTALLFTFTESVGSEYKFFRNEDGYIFNDLGILMLWLSSHHAVLSLYKFDMMQRRDRVISSFFSALIDILFYMGIGTFGIEAYPETESIWINNLENPQYNFLTLAYLTINILRYPNALDAITEDVLKFINLEEFIGSKTEKLVTFFISTSIIAPATYFSSLNDIRLWCLLISSLVMFVFPPVIGLRFCKFSVVDRTIMIITHIIGVALVLIAFYETFVN